MTQDDSVDASSAAMPVFGDIVNDTHSKPFKASFSNTFCEPVASE